MKNKNDRQKLERQRDDMAVKFGEYIFANKTNIRDTAKFFQTSKTTVHSYITKRLPDVNHQLYEKVRELLDTNIEIRHIKGGMSTKRLYDIKRESRRK